MRLDSDGAPAQAVSPDDSGGPPLLPGGALGRRGLGAARGADILYVEDDDAWAALVDCWVGFLGLTVKRVRDSAEFDAYIGASRQLPRCLLIDLRLGLESGFDLCDRIKKSPRLQAIPVILLTGARVRPVESFNHSALHCIRKSSNAESELRAALKAILEHQDRAQGVVDAGTLRLDGRAGSVLEGGELVATLEPGYFAAFKLLVQAAPEPVTESDLYEAFISRPYRTDDPETAARSTLRNYVSRLRKILGEALGSRILSVDRGYLFVPLPDRYISN